MVPTTTNTVPKTCKRVKLFLKTMEEINSETNFLKVNMKVIVTEFSVVAKVWTEFVQ